MQTLRKLTIIFFVGLITLYSCDKNTSTESQKEPVEDNTIVERESPENPPTETPQDKITDILSSYYQDLSNAEITEEKYFAPEVDKFFSSEGISRETVGQSIRNGFKNLEKRSIKLDTQSITIFQSGNEYVAEFGGTSTVTRKGASEVGNAALSQSGNF
jgi:hypothetical protein